MPSQDGAHLDNYFKPQTAFSDCQFRGGKLLVYNAAIHFTNDLFRKSLCPPGRFQHRRRTSRPSCKMPLRQRRIDHKSVEFDVWLFRDNMFDHVAITQDGDVDNAFDGYITVPTASTPHNTNDVVASSHS